MRRPGRTGSAGRFDAAGGLVVVGRHRRALGAVQHSMLVAYWHMFTTGELYHDLGGDYYQRRDPTRQINRLVNQLEHLGQHVTLQPAA